MDEDVTTASFAEEKALSGIVQEAWVVPRNRPSEPEEQVQDNLL